MKDITIDGQAYTFIECSGNRCEGCEGWENDELCDVFPSCTNGIWVKAKAPVQRKTLVVNRKTYKFVEQANCTGCAGTEFRDANGLLDCGKFKPCGGGIWLEENEVLASDAAAEVVRLWENKADFNEFQTAVDLLKEALARDKSRIY